ncbi:UvrD-helicase domain-containing protein [Halorubellus sp. PRR65]|uniref:UvrD-helicase domain-containing protein n=1 Tax=Halorubellus sp. PRR65 TaxID=3098148 RepID=UPI002B25E2A7|nr:UvrD-helicase domain-containing protein [Halorubellus sp. PRR65]
MTNSHDEAEETPIRLRGAQADIRDAYFDHDSGLFSLSCVPGAGKSTVTVRLAAEEILRRYADGDSTPEQRVAVISFNRDEAADLIPEICEQLRIIVEHDLTPAAEGVSTAEAEFLIQRIQRAPYVGTVDSFLRGILREFVSDVGFDEMPSVGSDALLQRVHRDCYERVRVDSGCAAELEALESAYPGGEYVDDVAEMLQSALTYCRDRRLSTSEFKQELERTRDSVYDGRPESFDDVVTAVERTVGDEAIGDRVRDGVADTDRDCLVAADRELYDDWSAHLEDFSTVLSAYREAYRELTREHGAVSHTDVAYLVTSYLDGGLDGSEHVDGVDEERRRRVLRTYRGRIRSLLIDEAQDIAEIQHAALSQIVQPDMRVFASGDVLQSVYLWRHASPTLFQSATTRGEYFGIEWDTHRNEMARTTYRCLPDVAEAINAIAEPMFADDARGNIGDLETDFPALEANREATDETSIHVASFASNHRPGSSDWVNPEDGGGEANVLATHLARGLADGTFTDASGDPLGITVLFRRRTRMDDYESAFEDEGLRVRNASEALFGCPAVQAVLAVCDWLVDPGSPDRIRQLVTDTEIGFAPLERVFEERQWDIDAVLGSAGQELSATQRRTLTGLRDLRNRYEVVERQPAAIYLEDVIERLALRSDTHGFLEVTDPQQRVANLDALVETVAEWEGDERYTPRELVDLLAPYRDQPRDGPVQPSTAGTDYDVDFRTVHNAKGDEDDVVVIADPGFDIWSQGPVNQRFPLQGPIAGLAPPLDTEIPSDIDIPPFVCDLYDTDGGRTRDVGLRWATARWSDTVSDTARGDDLVGPDRLQRLAANERAEAWRLLYVSLTRARDHLVLPLPQSLSNDRTRDRWVETLRDGLDFTGGTNSYTLPTEAGELGVGVNDVSMLASRANPSKATADPDTAVTRPRRDDLDPWIPRFVRPSTMHPLIEDPDSYVLSHLLGEPLHSDANEVPEELPLPFDQLGPHDVGTCLHGVLTALVERNVSEAELQSKSGVVRDVFDDVLQDTTTRVGVNERDTLWTFFESVLDDFLDSPLWDRIQRAESVSVEQPIDGVVRVDGVEVEIHGEADFVITLPNGERHVTDAKIALTEQTTTTKQRYEMQICAYAYLYTEQNESGESVHPTIETFGVDPGTVNASWPPQVIERRIEKMIE